MQRGMVHIYYGKGKGKTSAALGLVLRALKYDFNIAVLKFFKTRDISGEDAVLSAYDNVKVICAKYPHPQFMKQGRDRDKSFASQKLLFERAKRIIKGKYDIIVLDEVLDLVKEKIITSGELTRLFAEKKQAAELIVTGHYIDDSIIEYADLVTQMTWIKHYHSQGAAPRKGIEF